MISNKRIVAAVTAAAGLFWFGCGSDEEATPPPPAKPLDLCDGYRPLCERQVACGVAVVNHGETVAECLAMIDCGRTSADELDDHGVTVLESQITACKGALSTLSCGQVASLRAGFPEALGACYDFVRGDKGEGEACARIVPDECKPGFTCTFDAQCPGTCAATADLDCTVTSCGDGEYCSYQQGGCVALGALGGACEPNLSGDYGRRSCADGLWCGWGADEGPTCQTRIALGEACAACTDPDCCEDGAYCTLDQGEAAVCAPRLAESETCAFATMCADGLYCDFTSAACAPRRAAGATCPTGVEGACQLGSVCVGEEATGTCVALEDDGAVPSRAVIATGQPCVGTDLCALGAACVDAEGLLVVEAVGEGTCREALGAPGAACSPLNDPLGCAHGVCDFATAVCPERLEVDEACDSDGLNTACPYSVCLAGQCADLDDLVCQRVR